MATILSSQLSAFLGPVEHPAAETCTLRLHNALLVDPATYAAQHRAQQTSHGEVWIKGDTITYVGAEVPADKRPDFDAEYDLDGNLLTCGFKNAHAHSPMTFLRSRSDGLPLDRWLNEVCFPAEARLDGDKVYALTRVALLEYLSSGITSVFDMYFNARSMARASVDMGLRSVYAGSMSDFMSSVEEQEERYRYFADYHELISFHFGFHAQYTTSAARLRGLAELATSLGEPLYTHLSETESETRACVEQTGMTPAAYLDSLGVWNQGGAGFHGVWLSHDDMRLLAQRGVSIVSCPASNAKLASGIARVTDLRQSGLNVALGTDGAASNNALDFFREMYLFTVLQKLRTGDPGAVGPDGVLYAATTAGAQAMGLSACRALEAGQAADLLVIDLDQPNMQPHADTITNLVYSASKSNVLMTMVAGRILYEQGRFHVGVEPAQIYADANAACQQLF
ncbi:MAG: amidohydrolase [Coriobacteriia bacterium]|nr:amidohydrolase [Coriobacteriia bacterium]